MTVACLRASHQARCFVSDHVGGLQQKPRPQNAMLIVEWLVEKFGL
jgi:hypothetical protein